jgi:hypothetical protein
MNLLKKIAKKSPLLRFRSWLKRNDKHGQLNVNHHKTVFTDIYKTKRWGGSQADSVSGPGSDVRQTAVITNALPIIFCDFDISTLLDIPCGDFHWMKNVDLGEIDYIGADIVDVLINKNTQQFLSTAKSFLQLNIIEDKLPKVDLILCRDCLVHFSFEDIFQALDNICKSNSKYLLTTTFTSRKQNKDITTGNWRTLNLQQAPFMLPKPLKLINEGCTEARGTYTDKTLGFWKIADIRKALKKLQINAVSTR